MPQNFQVLRCYSCFVYQVHPTKKSNKFQCKLCGEKQSIKRHYGLGTGKECRIHVQKLNGLRGAMNETTSSQDELSDEYEHNNESISVNDVKPEKESKWIEYVDNSEVEVHKPDDPMFLGDSEVVLNVRKKRKTDARKNKLTISENAETKGLHDNVSKPHRNRNSFETQEENFESISYIHASKTHVKHDDPSLSQLKTVKDVTKDIANTKCFVPPLINKSSKWAQYTETNDNDIDNDKTSFNLKEEIYVPPRYSTGQVHNAKFLETGENKLNDLTEKNVTIPLEDRSLLKRTVQPTVRKQSKWAQYNEISQDLHQQNELRPHYRQSKQFSNKPQKLFSLCDDSDLDNVLDI